MTKKVFVDLSKAETDAELDTLIDHFLNELGLGEDDQEPNESDPQPRKGRRKPS